MADGCLAGRGATASGETVRERLWIWGHPAGVYNASYLAGCPTKSSIEPVAAAQRMGIANMIFVRYDAKPSPPFAGYYEPFQQLRQVYWSLVGAAATSADEREHVYRLAEANENITGFILDDFFHETSVRRGRESGEPWLAENNVQFPGDRDAHRPGGRGLRHPRIGPIGLEQW